MQRVIAMDLGRVKDYILQSRWQVYAVSIGYALVIATQANLISFQTSLAVQNADGSNSVLLYCSMCVVSLVLYMPMVTLLSRKTCLIIGDLPSIMFTCSMLLRDHWIVEVAAVLIGVGETLTISASGAIVASLTPGNKREDAAIQMSTNLEIFVATLGLGQTLATIVPEFILEDSDIQWNTTNASIYDIAKCGAADCPMEYAFKHHASIFGKLIPTENSLHVYLYVFLALQILGTILHVVATPATPADTMFGHQDGELQRILPSRRNSVILAFKHSLLRIKHHTVSKLRLLAAPIQFQYGMFCGFLWSEIGRAYVSCTMGVKHLGVVLFVTYLTSFSTNIIYNKYGFLIPKQMLYMVGFIVELSCYLLALVWQPATSAIYWLYVLAALLGMTHCIRRLTSYHVASAYADDLDASFLFNSGVVAFGNGMIFVWTNILCVYVKLYILMTHSLAATVLLMIAHHYYTN